MPAKKIVLSNDPVLIAMLQNSFFQREGFQLIPVLDGQTAFQAVEAEGPTLAIFDLSLLGEQALDCCRTLKMDPLLAATPVLLLIPAEQKQTLADLCWDAGCDGVLLWPCSAEEFLDSSCALLGISRRLARRFPVNFQLAFLDSKQKKHEGSCVNLNLGGMFLATRSLFPVNTQLDIEFTLPGFQTALACAVRVSWVNHPEWRKKNVLPCGMGVEFNGLSQTVRAALKEFVDELSYD